MKVKKCIIPIAGKGTRRLPITKTVSKEMFPILNEPTILLLVKECLKSGIEEIIFVVNKDNYKLLKSFFSENKELEKFLEGNNKKELLSELNEIITKIKFRYVFQNENIRGTAGAIFASRRYIKNEYFAVLFGDDLYDSEEPVLSQVIKEAEKYNCSVIGVSEVEEELKNYYYLVKYKKDNILDYFVRNNNEKEQASNHKMLGRMVLNSTFFDKVLESQKHDDNEYFIPDVLELLNEEIRTLKCNGIYYNIGNILGFIKANIAYGLKNDKIKEDLLDFIKNQIDR